MWLDPERLDMPLNLQKINMHFYIPIDTYWFIKYLILLENMFNTTFDNETMLILFVLFILQEMTPAPQAIVRA